MKKKVCLHVQDVHKMCIYIFNLCKYLKLIVSQFTLLVRHSAKYQATS